MSVVKPSFQYNDNLLELARAIASGEHVDSGELE